jgi:hypothetical protein
MTTRKNASTRTFPIVLKSIIADAVRDTPAFSRTDKKIRVLLRARAECVAIHERNTSWVAMNAAQYDLIRSTFDPVYAARIAKPARAPRKRNARTNASAATVD